MSHLKVTATVTLTYTVDTDNYNGETDPRAIFNSDMETDSVWLVVESDLDVLSVTGEEVPDPAAAEQP